MDVRARRGTWGGVAAGLAGLLGIGCSCADERRTPRDAGDGLDASSEDAAVTADASAVVDATTSTDAGPVDAGFDAHIDRTTFCMGMGPPVVVGDSTVGADSCAGAIATRVFQQALCTCTDANIVGYLQTRSFDSGAGTSDTAAGAPVGIDQNYLTGGYANVGGTFVVAGTSGLTFGGYVDVGGDARFAGNVSYAGYLRTARDLWVAGDVTSLGAVTVGRDLHQPSGRRLLSFPDVRGSTIRSSFTVPPPCACGPGELVDIAAIVAAGRRENDNADVGLAPNALADVVGIGVDLTLPCGRYYLEAIGGLGTITLHVPGRTALFVDGDINAVGALAIDLGPEGELDLFVAGNILSIGAGSFGDRARPSRSRIYVGGRGDVNLIGATGFVGNVYAPTSRITAPGATTVYGSLFGRRVDVPGYLDLHYDRAILDADAACTPEPACGACGVGPGCTDHTACVDGACRACASDADCCAPLVCQPDGTCGALLF